MKEWFCGRSAFDVKFIKTSILGAISFAKIVNFGLYPHISDAKTDPFSPFGADHFVYLNHIDIQFIEKYNL